MPLSTCRCSDRMVHSPGQEGRILYQAGEMPHRAYRSRTCLGLDLRRNLCVPHQYTPPIVLPGSFFFSNGSKRGISSFQLSALPCAPTMGGRRGDLLHCSSTRPDRPSHRQYLFTVGSSQRTRGNSGVLLISLWSNWERTHGTRYNPKRETLLSRYT